VNEIQISGLWVLVSIICAIGGYCVGQGHSDGFWIETIKKENLVYYEADRISGKTTLKWTNNGKPVLKE